MEKEIISVSYESKDCEKGLEWIKKDLLNEIERQMNELISSEPEIATFTIIYTAVNKP